MSLLQALSFSKFTDDQLLSITGAKWFKKIKHFFKKVAKAVVKVVKKVGEL